MHYMGWSPLDLGYREAMSGHVEAVLRHMSQQQRPHK